MKPKIIDTYIENGKEFTHYENGRLRVRTINEDPTKTDQTQKEQCDIKNIMKKYGNNLNNIPSPTNGFHGDFSEIPSFQQMQEILNQGTAAFEALPSKLRKRFDNDPKEFMEFLSDPTNNEEAYSLGLKIKPQIHSQPEINDETKNANKNANNKSSKIKTSTGNTDSDE